MTASSSKPTVRPKSATVNTREYDEAAMHKRFLPMSESIHSRSENELGFNPVDVTPRSLSLLAGNLRQFVESALGRDADPAWKKITKFPHQLFLDYAPSGALDIMLCACLNFKALHGLRRLEFSNIDKREFYFDLLLRIQKSLKQARLLPMVKVFFARTVPTSVQPSLRAIVSKRGVTVSSASAATHIVYPDPPGSTAAETEGTDYCRALQHKDKAALVHWWYYPDSYDSWIPREDVDGVPDPPEQHEGPWHVQMRWLQDTELFNEWMNEIDYEIPDEGRMTVIRAPRAETSTASVKDKSGKTDAEKASKKRRRMLSSSSSKQLAESDRDARSNHSARPDKMSIANVTDDSDEETIRKPKRHSESGKDRKRRDGKSGKESGDGQHARKKARVGEEGNGKQLPSIKVRLPIRPPNEKSKDRSRDRGKDRKGTESGRQEAKDTSVEMKEVNIRVKLPKFGDAKRAADHPEPKMSSRDIPKESDNDNVSSARRTPASRTGEEKSAAIEQSKGGVPKSDSAALPPKPGHKPCGGEDAAGDDGAQEQKRPFSRRRSKKKERRSHSRMPGVSMVDDAVPIPEGELPRIRNISSEGGNMTAMNVVSGSDEEAIDGNRNMGTDGVSTREKGKTSDAEGNDMDVDAGQGNGRIIAVSERMLSGDAANAPVSTADVVEALPPVTVRIPAHARWFRTDAIHDIERRSLPEFWNSRGESKTPLVYKKYRDFMIDVWRQSPEKHLTATAARRHLAGDVCAILRVHAFLEYWGLINYGTEPESKPYLNSALRPRHSRPTPMQLDTNIPGPVNGVPRLLFFEEPRPPRRDNAPVSLQKAIKTAKEKSATARNRVLSRRELYATAAATKYECDACGSDCSRMRYHCVGSADMELCPSCFANGMYPETLSARDFEQLTTVLSSEAYDGTVWSEAEVLLLLEGLEKYGDNWNQVADHVGTKNNDQCVLQFLRMPLEDSFLEDQIGNWAPGDEGVEDGDGLQDATASGEHKFARPLLPFYDTANPVMAQVAFLAASVDPEVAAAAAQAALNAIMAQSGQKGTAKEATSSQAKVLLQNSDRHANQPATENGLANKDGMGNSSNLHALPGKQLDTVAVEAAAAVGLAAAVGKAKDKLQAETREIDRRYAVAIETKMRSVDLKLKEVERLELHLRRERERLEKQRQQVFAERVDASMMRIQSEAQARATAPQPVAGNVMRTSATIPQAYPGSTAAAQRPPTGMGTMSMQHGHGALRQSQVPMQQTQLPMQQPQIQMPQGQMQMQQAQRTMQHSQIPMQQVQVPMQQSQLPMQQRPIAMQPGPVPVQPGPLPVQPGPAPGQQQSGIMPMQTDGGPNK